MTELGTITYDEPGRQWLLELAPHVMIRAKRVFGKVRTSAQRVIGLSDTPENARDLEWFLERYPMTIERGRYLAERATEHRERQALVDDLLSKRRPPPSFDLALPPREYQKTAASLLLARGSLLLVDELGLGKTVSAIATYCDGRTLPALVVTLTSLTRQWQEQLRKFAPKLTSHILKKGTPYDIAGAMKRGRGAQLGLPAALPDVIITNYHKLSGWAATLAPVLSSVVFDEIQELRHPGTAKYEAADHIARSVAYRMGLTGTPIYNMGIEMFHVLSILEGDVLGTSEEFSREWCHGDRIGDPKAFGVYARENGMMLRRTRVDVGRECPPVSRIPHFIDIDERALDHVRSNATELARIILAKSETEKGAKMRASEELSNLLRQATGIGKAPYVADFVRLLVEQGKKVLLFGWHHAVYDLWREKLADLNPVFFTGKETPTQKEAAKERFLTGDAKVLVMSLRAGAGLDGLQSGCHVVVFGELDWSPGVHEQCVGRIDRDGQEWNVLVYFLIAESGSDPIVCDVLQLKKEQVDNIRDPNRELVEALQVDPDHVKKLAASWLEQHTKKTEAA